MIINGAGGTYKWMKVGNQAGWAQFVCHGIGQWGGGGAGGGDGGVVDMVVLLWWWCWWWWCCCGEVVTLPHT